MASVYGPEASNLGPGARAGAWFGGSPDLPPARAESRSGPESKMVKWCREVEGTLKRERQAVQELALAKAERERLDEREQAIRKVERELAGLRLHLQEEKARLTGSVPSEPASDPEPDGDPPPPTPLPPPPTAPDLEPAATAKLHRSSMLADPQLKKQR